MATLDTGRRVVQASIKPNDTECDSSKWLGTLPGMDFSQSVGEYLDDVQGEKRCQLKETRHHILGQVRRRGSGD